MQRTGRSPRVGQAATEGPAAALEQLLIRASEGDRAALRPLFDLLWPFLLRIATRGLSVRADAEDAAQRAILTVFDQLPDLDRRRSPVAWTATIAWYEVLTVRRRIARRREDARGTTLLEEHPAATPDPEVQLGEAELAQAVRDAVGELPERDRQALAAFWSDDPMSTGETPRKRRARAIHRLRGLWRRTDG